MRIFYGTSSGGVREHNEDALALPQKIVAQDEAEFGEYFRASATERPLLLAIIDGMGGYLGGQVASRFAAQIFSDAQCPAGMDAEGKGAFILGLCKASLAQFKALALECPELARMGATLAGVILEGEHAYAFNCGDARVYRLRKGFLERLTRDHSLVQALYESGQIDEETMRTHPKKNFVTSAIHPEKPLELYDYSCMLAEGDSLLLCSDGVWEALSPEEIEEALRAPDAAQNLWRVLQEMKRSDNVSFIVIS